MRGALGEVEHAERLVDVPGRGVLEGHVEQRGGVVRQATAREVPRPLVERVELERLGEQPVRLVVSAEAAQGQREQVAHLQVVGVVPTGT